MSKWICKNCGSTDVECRAWVKLNEPYSNKTIDCIATRPLIGWGDSDDSWCNNCKGHHGVILASGKPLEGQTENTYENKNET